jgi:putative acetyltransferase
MTGPVSIRDEQPADADAIRAVTLAAFAGMAYSHQTEAAIIEALRAAGALALSLVAVEAGAVLGHVGFSPVALDGDTGRGWYGLGPLSVRPDRQGQGIGGALVREGLRRLKERGARGCVLVGDPAYYQRFGFGPAPSLTLPDVPAAYFMALALDGAVPAGTVAFHPGFAARDDDRAG